MKPKKSANEAVEELREARRKRKEEEREKLKKEILEKRHIIHERIRCPICESLQTYFRFSSQVMVCKRCGYFWKPGDLE